MGRLGQYVLILIIELVIQKLTLLFPLRSVPGLPPAPKATHQPPAVSAREMELQVLFVDLAKNDLVLLLTLESYCIPQYLEF